MNHVRWVEVPASAGNYQLALGVLAEKYVREAGADPSLVMSLAERLRESAVMGMRKWSGKALTTVRINADRFEMEFSDGSVDWDNI